MANEIKLEIYTFGIRGKRENEYIKLDSLSEDVDFMTFFKEYISSFEKILLVNDKQKKSIQFDGKNIKFNSGKRLISGVIESGDYGVESKIVNKDTKKQKFTKLADDLDIKPFYFLLYIPANKTKGIIILQRLGIYGINSVFTSHLDSFFKSKFDGLVLDFAPFVSKSLAKSFIDKGSIRELILRRYNLPSDVIDKLGLTQFHEDILSIELKISSKPNHAINLNKRVKKFINEPNAAFFDVPELKRIGFDGENESKIKVTMGKNTRTIDLSDTGQIRPYYDIHDEVKKKPNGHPEFTSIDLIAKSHLNDLLSEINA